ncbi:MAG: hypothetical protein LBK22_05690 [Tannerella sp.]|jgi:hypothetical protein|nr:hypothetical protein [Tannerella sp.]
MTAQIGERLHYDGENYSMAAQPFDVYLKKYNIRTASDCTANWRGYYGAWEIKDDKLFLVSISANILKEDRKQGFLHRSEDYSTVGLDYFFPGQKEVFAEWFSGEVRIPCGEMLHYVHMGYSSIFEQDLFLEFKEGVLINERLVDNRKQSDQAEDENNKQHKPVTKKGWVNAFLRIFEDKND